MNTEVTEITVNGVVYVPKPAAMAALAVDVSGMPYCIVRSRDAGVFAAYVLRNDGSTYELRKARRLWYWSGAASLSQLALEGVKKPDECKFPDEVDGMIVLGVCEVIYATEAARFSIAGVKPWRQ